MSEVTNLFTERWRSGEHIGASQPAAQVLLRKGRFRRRFASWLGGDISAKIPDESDSHTWQAFWEGFAAGNAFEAWKEVPNVEEITLEHSFDQNGITSLTLVIENVVMKEQAAVSPFTGLWHSIERGYLAPWKGYRPPGFPEEFAQVPEWYSLLARNCQLMIFQGYGTDTLTPSFTGLIDDVDLVSRPDRITVTARDFGKVLADSRIFGYNKSPQVKDPVIFADARQADKRQSVGTAGPGDSSSARAGHPERFVVDDLTSSDWESGAHSIQDFTEWVQIRLPAGRYVNFDLGPSFQHMEAFVGIYARPQAHGRTARKDGVPLNEGWVNEGKIGDVPGDNGGWPYIKHIGATSGQRTYLLDAEYELGANSILRVGFRNLQRAGDGKFRAGVRTLKAIKRVTSSEAKKGKWILVNDVSDIVRCVLRWAGFKEWDVEDTGVRLQDNYVTNRGNFYMDVIKQMADTTGYVFFMNDPTDEDSIGVPTFRQNSSLRSTNAPGPDGSPKPLAAIRETDVLTAIDVKLTDEPLSYIIRVRGAQASIVQGGRMIGSDSIRRIMAVYRPPWTTNERMGGVIKHEILTLPQLKTQLDCQVGCYLVALAEALQSATAVFEIPGNPSFELDDQIYLVDSGTGISTRLWLANRSQTMVLGEETSWKCSMGGSLIDTPDIDELRQQMADARANGVPIAPVPVALGGAPQPV